MSDTTTIFSDLLNLAHISFEPPLTQTSSETFSGTGPEQFTLGNLSVNIFSDQPTTVTATADSHTASGNGLVFVAASGNVTGWTITTQTFQALPS